MSTFYIRNHTISPISVFNSGVTVPANSTYEIPPSDQHLWDCQEVSNLIDSGSFSLYEKDNIFKTKVTATFNFSKEIICFEDFFLRGYSSSLVNQYDFTPVNNSGTSSLEAASVGDDYQGIHILNSSNNNSSRPLLESFNATNKIKLNTKKFTFEQRVRVETLSTTQQRFTTSYGLMDINTAGLPANGMLFLYDTSISPNWLVVTVSSSSPLIVDSNVPVVASQWYRLKVEYSKNNILFFIDDSLVYPMSKETPIVPLRFIFKLEKKTGTQARTTSIDYITWFLDRG